MADMAQANAFLENVESLVTSKFNNVSELADESWGLTTQYLNELSTEVANFTFDPMNLSWIISPITHGNYSPAMPVEPNMVLTLPTTPVADALEEIAVESVDVASLDAVAPLIVIPDDPDPDWPEDPGVAPNVSDVDVAAKPTYDIPSVPSLGDITVQAPPEDEVPAFEATEPTFNVDAPQSIFLYEEATYSSSLKLATEAKLLDIVENGGTGLDDTVEAAIWDRALSRKQTADLAKHDEAERYFSSRGFNIPQGALVARLDELITERARAEDDINYDIMTEQAKLAQTNTHFAITSAIQYESSIMAYLGGVAQRTLDSSKYAQEAAIALFNAGVERYNAQLRGYQTAATIYESRIRASMLILEKYKLRLEGTRLQSDIQRSRVDIYKTQVDALTSLMNLYRVEMDSARIKSDIERLKLEGYREKVGAYTARIGAVVSRYNAYQAQISGEVAKASVYSEQVKAYLANIQGSKVRSDISIAEAGVKLDSNRFLVEKYRAELERYRSETQARLGEVESKGTVYGHRVSMYDADTRAASSRMAADIESYRARSAHANDVVNQRIMQAKINLEELTRLHNIQVEAIKAGAVVSSQRAASALSSVAAGAQLSFRGGFDESKSEIEHTNIG
jgi:chromosome condensin MukBEF MukE localization factor